MKEEGRKVCRLYPSGGERNSSGVGLPRARAVARPSWSCWRSVVLARLQRNNFQRRRRPPPPSPSRRDRRGTPAMRSTRDSIPASRTLARRGAAHLAQHVDRRRQHRCSFTSTTTPGATAAPPGCASCILRRADRPPAARPETDWGWTDITSLRVIRSGASGRRHQPHSLHRARRWQSRRIGRLPRCRWIRRWARAKRSTCEITWSSRVPAHLCAHRRRWRPLLPRPVVSQDRRVRRLRLELPPVPRRRPSSSPTSVTTTCG